MSWHMSPRYGHGILVSGYPVLTAVNWPYCEYPILKSYIKDVDLPRHVWDTPPFLLIVSPTSPVQSVDEFLRTLGQSCDNETKRGWPYSMSMGLCPARAKPHYKWVQRRVLTDWIFYHANVLAKRFYLNGNTTAGADPHQFIPFYENQSDFP